jgi:hypothetical protein
MPVISIYSVQVSSEHGTRGFDPAQSETPHCDVAVLPDFAYRLQFFVCFLHFSLFTQSGCYYEYSKPVTCLFFLNMYCTMPRTCVLGLVLVLAPILVILIQVPCRTEAASVAQHLQLQKHKRGGSSHLLPPHMLQSHSHVSMELHCKRDRHGWHGKHKKLSAMFNAHFLDFYCRCNGLDKSHMWSCDFGLKVISKQVRKDGKRYYNERFMFHKNKGVFGMYKGGYPTPILRLQFDGHRIWTSLKNGHYHSAPRSDKHLLWEFNPGGSYRLALSECSQLVLWNQYKTHRHPKRCNRSLGWSVRKVGPLKEKRSSSTSSVKKIVAPRGSKVKISRHESSTQTSSSTNQYSRTTKKESEAKSRVSFRYSQSAGLLGTGASSSFEATAEARTFNSQVENVFQSSFAEMRKSNSLDASVDIVSKTGRINIRQGVSVMHFSARGLISLWETMPTDVYKELPIDVSEDQPTSDVLEIYE